MHFVFHPHHEAVVVPSTEYQKYLDDGWYDSPLKFPKVEEAKVGLAEMPVEAPAIKKPGRPPKSKAEPEKVLNVAEDDEPPLDAA